VMAPLPVDARARLDRLFGPEKVEYGLRLAART
jgi:hypothetical protein